ncbi:Neuronal acetylcholine receptor subunit alpha-6 [Mizuhopecten yessoensis]|uniref:Neuronal acetylcholine receptor subunit alpha-6 n=1 Tax=Mizuhopecten yessoensis TaxID=6573 RepID=A0A210QRC9_MIZYE|nr:Neuronal acetylcholine receptor subunit alpha-6 [Mizuhopecten yessoensis]
MALDNGFTKMKALGDSFVLISVLSDGSLLWEPYEVFQTKCTMDVEYVPVDKQTCAINVRVWTSEIEEVIVRLSKFAISLTNFQANSEWDLVGHSAETFILTQSSMIIFSISIQRKPQYYMYNIVSPILMLSLQSVFTFAIPLESGEQLGFCMTVYLAFAVFVSASLPVSSVLSLLGKYLLFLLVIGTLIVIISTLELRIHFRESSREIPGCVQGLVRSSPFLQCRTCRQRSVDQMPEKVCRF